MLEQPVPNPLAKNPNVHTHKVFAAIGLILIGTIIGVVGIWWYLENQSGVKDNAADEVTKTKVSTTLAKKDETSDWKTYNNKSVGVFVKYPNSLKYEDYLESGKENVRFGTGSSTIVYSYFSIDKYTGNKEKYDSLLSEGVGKPKILAPTEVSGENTSTRLTDITVGGFTALRTKLEPGEDSPNTYVLDILIKKDSDYYKISTSADTKEDFDSNSNTLDIMLSTLRFL